MMHTKIDYAVTIPAFILSMALVFTMIASCSPEEPCDWSRPMERAGGYHGQACNGQMTGFGKMQYDDGRRYRGYWDNGKHHGFGEYHMKNGALYSGEFDHDVFSGFGVYAYISGELEGLRHLGRYVDNKLEGLGAFNAPDGRIYLGNYKNDLWDGLGYFEKSNPNLNNLLEYQYFGEFREGKRTGQGMALLPEGDLLMGEWKDGQILHGMMIYNFRSATPARYSGPFKNNLPHGKGVLQFGDGGRYAGDFEAGLFSGKGVVDFALDDPEYRRYEGEFRDDMFSGHGVLHYADGRSYAGQFREGRPDGEGILSGRNEGVIHFGEFRNGEAIRRGDGSDLQ